MTGRVSVWAPYARRLRLVIAGVPEPLPMSRSSDGWWHLNDPRLSDGARYGLSVDDDPAVLPDPRSRRQPDGVHQMSAIYHHRYAWHDHAWPGRDLRESVIYELHVGTFTEDATFDGVVQRLDHLVALGVTHIELLPVNDFNGIWNWGYDGVLWYSVHEAYGGPDGLKGLVDACHRRGIAVLLDVVYNHLGPSGNYLARFGPYLSETRSAWGEHINLDGPGSAGVRRYIVDNALMWLTDFHLDGLRLDAVDALQDSSPVHVLAELSGRVAGLSQELGRPLSLVAESDLNDPKVITPVAGGGWGMDAQWDDDVHHAWHALLTGERRAYYVDFGSLEVVATVLGRAFLHEGGYSTFLGHRHGRPIDPRTPGYRFVVSLQNHDQVGNRAAGERLPELTSQGRLRIGAVLLFTSPFTPMLWMGEEWAATTRWPYFTSHPEPDLGAAVAAGRIEEFSTYDWDLSEMPDPQDPATYRSAILRWRESETGHHAEMLALYRELIRLRGERPELSDPDLTSVEVRYDSAAGWLAIGRGVLLVVANFSSRPVVVPAASSARDDDLAVTARILLQTADGVDARSGGFAVPPESAAIIELGSEVLRLRTQGVR
jgi:maltooligosyltrehalose trehalohydrolase